MKQKHMQLIALIFIELILLLPISMVSALIITHEPNPARDITGNSSTIEWQTDAESTSRVDYGKSKQLGDDTTIAAFDTFHSVGLANLTPNSRYYFQLTSITATGDYRVDNNNGQFYSFLTKSQGDIIAPAISNVTLMALTSSTATIRWETDESSDSTVRYGLKDGNLSESKYSAGNVMTHVVTIPASDGVLYDYVVQSCDKNNNCRDSPRQFFRGGADISPPEVNVELPEWHHSSRIDLVGTTDPYSQVRLYIDGSLARMLSSQQTGEEGKITFLNVALPNPENLLKIVATDQIGNEGELEQMVRIDPAPPTLSVSGLTSPTNNPAATLQINTNEPVTLIIEVGLIDDILPKKIFNLETKQLSQTIVDLQWDALNVSDLDGYVVYRMEEGDAWIRIAHAAQNTYQDAKIKTGTKYSYKVAGYDKHCNEGLFSDVLAVDVPGDKITGGIPDLIEDVEIACDMIKTRAYDGGATTETVSFEEGLNKVIITAVDRGGHQVVYRNQTLFDMYPPDFEFTNLAEISPTYIPTVTVEGKVSEEASILVLIDGKVVSGMGPFPTDAEGRFSFPVDLSRANPASADDLSIHLPALSALSGDTPSATGTPAWINEVTLIAVDATGSRSIPVDGVSKQEILFTTCGAGSAFRVDIGGTTGSVFGAAALSPPALNTRLMLEGAEIISFPIQLNYTGSGNVQIDGVSLSKDPVSKAAEENYDSDWVTLSTMCNPEKTVCLVQMPVQVPADQMPEGENMTMYAKELNISNHRCTEIDSDGACKENECLTPSFGCIKVPMTLEISYRTVREGPEGDAYQREHPGQPLVESKVQKTCWPLEMTIDRRVNPDIIPGGLLRGAQGFLNNTINLIDAIYEPLNTIRQYVFYACSLMWAVNFFAQFSVNTACKSTDIKGLDVALEVFQKTSGAASGTPTQVNMDYAKVGVCDIEYPLKPEASVTMSAEQTAAMAAANQQCKACENAVKAKMESEWSMSQLCDRIWCPSAPTLQKYIKEAKAPKQIKSTKNPYNHDYYLGDSCGCDLSEGASGGNLICNPVTAGKTVSTDFETIKRVYEYYLDAKKDEKENTYEGDIDRALFECSGPHDAKPQCCGYEYMKKWGSACGMPFNDEAWFNEIQQSLCLAGQAANKPSILKDIKKDSSETGKGTATVNCQRTFNSIAGFCEAGGNASGVEPLPIGTLKTPLPPTAPAVDSDDNRVFACIKQPSKETDAYIVKFCYKTKRDVFDKAIGSDSSVGTASDNFFPFRKEWGFYSRPDWDVSGEFKDADDPKKEDAAKLRFRPKFNQAVTGTEPDKIYEQIKNYVGVPDKPYVVEPTSSLWRTIQCMCLSGLLASLSLWKRVFTALMNCFKTIEETGDGSPGICQAAVSVYVCDMIYEMIQCFSSRSGGGAGGRQSGGSSSSFFSALSGAGTAVSDSVTGRYGDSPMWESMFSENKVMHAICVWAFTGTWDIDLGAMLEGNSSLPVTESIGALYPCNRRYKSFNPATSPEGLTTWLYQFGVALIPGADLTYKLKLICESGYECSEAEGFERGACDCRNGEQELIVTTPEVTGQLSRSAELNTEVFYQVENANYRYNKAILEWEYTDNDGNLKKDSVDCKLNQISGAPGFCNFDIAHGMFRCSLGISTDNWAKLNRVEPNYPGAQPAFKIGDDIEILVDVQQAIPSNPECSSGDCEYTKYIVGTVYNPSGGVVWTNEVERKRLNTAGQSIITNLPSSSHISTISASTFNDYVGRTTVSTTQDACLRGTHPNVRIDKCQPGDSSTSCNQRCSGFQITFSGTPSPGKKTYIFATNRSHYAMFIPENTGKRPSFDVNTAKANLDPGTNTYYIPAAVQDGDMGKKKEDVETAEVFDLGNGNLKATIVGSPSITYAEVVIIVDVPATGQVAAGTGAAANVCAAYNTYEKAKAKPWKAEYKIYKAKKIGGRYERSNDLEPGQSTMSTNFYVVCSPSIAIAGVQLTRACGDGTKAETKACWCDAQLQSDGLKDPENTNFDCGPGSSAGAGFNYCVDNKCADNPAAQPCPTGVPAINTPISADCICGSSTCSASLKQVCGMGSPLLAATYRTGDCLLNPVCPTSTKAEGKQIAAGNLGAGEKCYCISGDSAKECGKDQYCCATSGTCVVDISQCPAQDYPVISFASIKDASGGDAVTTEGGTIPAPGDAEKKYTVNFNVDNNNKAYTAKVDQLAPESVSGTEESFSGTDARKPSLEFRVRPTDKNTEFKFKITVTDLTSTPARTREKTVTFMTGGVTGEPVLTIAEISFIDPADSQKKVIQKQDDGYYYIRTTSGIDYTIKLNMQNHQNPGTLTIVSSQYDGGSYSEYATPKSIPQLASQPSYTLDYAFKIISPDSNKEYSLDFVLTNPDTGLSSTKPIKVKEFRPTYYNFYISELRADGSTSLPLDDYYVTNQKTQFVEIVKGFGIKFSFLNQGESAFKGAEFLQLDNYGAVINTYTPTTTPNLKFESSDVVGGMGAHYIALDQSFFNVGTPYFFKFRGKQPDGIYTETGKLRLDFIEAPTKVTVRGVEFKNKADDSEAIVPFANSNTRLDLSNSPGANFPSLGNGETKKVYFLDNEQDYRITFWIPNSIKTASTELWLEPAPMSETQSNFPNRIEVNKQEGYVDIPRDRLFYGALNIKSKTPGGSERIENSVYAVISKQAWVLVKDNYDGDCFAYESGYKALYYINQDSPENYPQGPSWAEKEDGLCIYPYTAGSGSHDNIYGDWINIHVLDDYSGDELTTQFRVEDAFEDGPLIPYFDFTQGEASDDQQVKQQQFRACNMLHKRQPFFIEGNAAINPDRSQVNTEFWNRAHPLKQEDYVYPQAFLIVSYPFEGWMPSDISTACTQKYG